MAENRKYYATQTHPAQFVNLAKEDDNGKFSVSFLVAENDREHNTLVDMVKDAQAAGVKEFGERWLEGGKDGNFYLPFKPATTKDGELTGDFRYSPSSKFQPECFQLGEDGEKVKIDPAKVNYGAECRYLVNAYPYKSHGKHGVALGLRAVLMVTPGKTIADLFD